MKIYSLLKTIVFLLISTASFSQKNIRLERFDYKVNYMLPPVKPLDPTYLTYDVSFVPNGINFNEIGFETDGSDLSKNYFNIQGFKRVDAGGHFNVEVQIDAPRFDSPEIKENKETYKDKEGKVTTTLSYTFSFDYFVPLSASIKDYKGVVLEEKTISTNGRKEKYTSKAAATKSALESTMKKELPQIRNKIIREFVTSQLNSYEGSLNYTYGYREIRNSARSTFMPNDKDLSENDIIREKIVELSSRFGKMTISEGLDFHSFKDDIDFFESLIKKFSGDTKTDEKVRYISLYNLHNICYWNDKHDLAIDYANKLILNGYDKKDGETLLSNANYSQNLLKDNNLTSRHFVRNISDARPAIAELVVSGRGMPKEIETLDLSKPKHSESEYLANITEGLQATLEGFQEAKENRAMGYTDDLKSFFSVFEEKRILTNEAILFFPKNDDFYYYATLFHSLGFKYKEALVFAEKAANLKHSERNQLALAEQLIQNKELERGAEIFSILILKEPERSIFYMKRGELSLKMKDTISAEKDFLRYVDLDKNETTIFNLAKFYYTTKKLEKCVEIYSDLIENYQNKNYWYFHNRGEAKKSMKDYIEAKKDYEKAYELMPSSGHMVADIGVMNEYLKNFNEAEICYEKAVELSPNYQNYMYLSELQYKQQDYSKAINSISKRLDYFPWHIPSQEKLAFTKYFLKLYNDSMNDFELLIASENKYYEKDNAYAGRGLILFEQGNLKEAKSDFQKSLKINKENKYALIGLDKLSKN